MGAGKGTVLSWSVGLVVCISFVSACVTCLLGIRAPPGQQLDFGTWNSSSILTSIWLEAEKSRVMRLTGFSYLSQQSLLNRSFPILFP